jgi:hypothetical protein
MLFAHYSTTRILFDFITMPSFFRWLLRGIDRAGNQLVTLLFADGLDQVTPWSFDADGFPGFLFIAGLEKFRRRSLMTPWFSRRHIDGVGNGGADSRGCTEEGGQEQMGNQSFLHGISLVGMREGTRPGCLFNGANLSGKFAKNVEEKRKLQPGSQGGWNPSPVMW